MEPSPEVGRCRRCLCQVSGVQTGYTAPLLHEVIRGRFPLTMWQIDFIETLSKAQGASYALTTVDMTTRLLFAWPCVTADQKYTVQALYQARCTPVSYLVIRLLPPSEACLAISTTLVPLAYDRPQ